MRRRRCFCGEDLYPAAGYLVEGHIGNVARCSKCGTEWAWHRLDDGGLVMASGKTRDEAVAKVGGERR